VLTPLFRRLGALLLALAVAAPPAHAQLPALGDGGDLTVAAERKLGERVARELYRDPDFIDDPVLDEYVAGIWQRLLTAARERGELGPDMDDRFAWQVLLGKDREINAFALPGGWMGLNLGLISATSSRDEVAAVLGHELSHITQRHISRMMSQQSRQLPIMMAAMLLGALTLGRNADAGNALIAGGQAVAAQSQINFTRDMEREADRIGLGVMTQAGFDPRGFASMFEKLQQASRLTDNGAFPYLRSHPLTTERIAEVRQRQQLAPTLPPAPPDVVHAMMAGRARVLSNPGVDVLRSFTTPNALSEGGDRARQAGALYAAALAEARLRDFPAAMRHAQALATLVADTPEAARQAGLLAAEIAQQAGQPGPALALAKAQPLRRPELVLSSEAALQAGQASAASERLQTWVSTHPRDGQAWTLLSRAWTAQGQTLRAIRADAESHAAELDYQAALDRLRGAQDLVRRSATGSRDYFEASIIDARAREMQSLLREQALER